MTEPEVRVAASPAELARLAAELVVERLAEAISNRGEARWVLAGGTTPLALYGWLATRGSEALDWSRVRFFWGDERCVPPTHHDSNYRSAAAVLLEPLSITADRIHRIRGEIGPERGAADYDHLVAERLSAAPWDLVLLGLGADGHTASIFPPGRAASAGDPWVEASRAPTEPSERVTLTVRGLSRARAVVFLVAGEEKATAVARSLAGDGSLPASHVGAACGATFWCLDRAAAGAARGPDALRG